MVKEEPSLDARAAAPRHATGDKASAEAVPPLECVFVGRIGGFLSDTSRLSLRISSGGEIRGQVWRKRPVPAAKLLAAPADGINTAPNGVGGLKRRRVKAAAVVESEGDVAHAPTEAADAPRGWLGHDHVLIAHLVGSAVRKQTHTLGASIDRQSALSGDEAAIRAPNAVQSAAEAPFEYCCTFDVTKRADHVDRHTVRCHVDFSAAPLDSTERCDGGIADGQWWLPYQRPASKSSGDHSTSGSDASPSSINEPSNPEEKPFQLKRIAPGATTDDTDAAAGRRSRLYPLRPGKYDFRGFTTYETPVASPTPRRRGRRRRSYVPPAVTKDECIVSLRLLPDGTLRGTSRELVHPQVCSLYGNWQINRVVYILEYHVRDAVGHFRYSGGVDASAEEDKLVGKWRNVDEGHADGYDGGKGEFELALVHARYDADAGAKRKREKRQSPMSTCEAVPSIVDQAVAPVVNPESQQGVETVPGGVIVDMDEEDAVDVTALTTGHYKLKGEATDSDEYEYAFELAVTLYPGGRLVGACHERVFEQTRPVTGRWDRASISYDQKYVVRREVGIYLYQGELSKDAVVIRGWWHNAEEKAASIPSEHGTFALAITSVERFWSTDSHRDFPRGFRAAVHCLLLCSARSHALPGALWTHILAFCDEKWFVPSVDEEVKSVDGKLEVKAEQVLV